MLPVHLLDRPAAYVLAGSALAIEEPNQDAGELATEAGTASPRIKLGDAWHALEAAGVIPEYRQAGRAYFKLPGGRLLVMPNRSVFDHGIMCDDLLAVL